jgi:hypothetical protein
MTYFRKCFLDYYYSIMKILGGCFLKGYGGEKKFSMLVQDSLPIDTTIAKCLSMLIKKLSKSAPPNRQLPEARSLHNI